MLQNKNAQTWRVVPLKPALTQWPLGLRVATHKDFPIFCHSKTSNFWFVTQSGKKTPNFWFLSPKNPSFWLFDPNFHHSQ